MHHDRSRQQAGFSFAELAFALLILVVSAAVLINHLAVNYQTTHSERDRVFAFSKAQAILSEIQNYVDRGEIEAVDLDTLDDGVINKATLSIQTTAGVLVAPNHVVSGNMQRNGQWLWSRRITVQPFTSADNRNVRYVTVRVYRKDQHGNERALADLSAVINSSGESFPSTQVHDVYLLAIENIPGWWVYMDSIRPFVESMIMDLQTRNPGLELRTHWITKASFGRNQTYRPYINSVVDSTVAIPDVYNYPGRMPTGSASAFYYVPDNIKARINVEGLENNGYDSYSNPHPYALADFFNHAMRYPDELALWTARVNAVQACEDAIAAAVAAGTLPPAELNDMSKEPTLRLFLEDLYSSPTKYKNAMVINLHGEMLPMPALRNYSDPAKSQVAYPNLRVVTHPEELRTKNNDAGVTDPLKFRMYAFGYQTSTTLYGPDVMADPMVVEFVGVNLTSSTEPTKLSASCTLRNLPGRGLLNPYATSWQTANHVSAVSLPTTAMYYTAQYVAPSGGAEGFTRVYLFNTPTKCTPDATGRGLPATERGRLYQMDYVPCPVALDAVTSVPSFDAMDLTSTNNLKPKNTARWTLSIAPAVLTNGSFIAGNPTGDVVMQVRTRIATGYTASSSDWQNGGIMWPTPATGFDPDNLSVTYAWWTNSKEDVPFTERAQFQGDPRHLPYKDCFRNGDDFPNSFNWYLDDLNNPTIVAVPEPAVDDFTTIATSSAASPLRDRWGGGALACDAPRFLQLLREGLVKSRCFFSAITGWSNYFLGVGNEIGYEAQNGYPSSIPTNFDPYGVPGSWGYMNTVISARRYVRAQGAADYWWGIPWLGELVPDAYVSSQWLDTASGTQRGNLTAGTAANRFYQGTCNSVYVSSTRQAYGTALFNNVQRMNTYGCTSLFNIGSAAATFQHSSASTNGTLTAKGTELASNYNLSVPATAPVSRPFRIDAASAVAEHWSYAPYATKYTASLWQTYYTHSAGAGAGVVKLVDPTNANAAYMVINGIANTVTNGTPFIAQWNLLTLVHTFLEAGDTTNTLRSKELPRIEIESPTDITELDNPSTIVVQHSVEWKRWDGLPYTATGTFAESEAELEYSILFSRDGGGTWLHVQDGSAATPGVRDPAYVIADAGGGNESYDWDVSAGFPEGTYMLRVDAFRVGQTMHYAYHQTRLFIQR